jgi:hypothetical protein
MWLIWLLTPGLRRLFELSAAHSDADPLALLPFLVTGLIAILELWRAPLTRSARWAVALGLTGYAIGIPTGLASPESMLFGLFAYGVGVLAFGLGYTEPLRGQLTLRRVLVVAMPVLSVYGIWQYFYLPKWDQQWLETVNFVTAGAPAEDKVRVFASLNSPGTFAMMLAITAAAFLVGRRLPPWSLLGLGLVLTALALTYVRGAWLALTVAALAATVATRGRLLPRLGFVIALLVGAVAYSAAHGATGGVVIERFSTFGSLGSDESTQTRLSTPLQLAPQAASKPLGAGLGSAGEASRLSSGEGFRYTDNGYLSLLYQVGPFGFVLVIGVILAGLRRAWRNARAGPRGIDLFVFALIVFVLVASLTGDMFYGITGIVFWYLLGAAWRRQDVRLAARADPRGGLQPSR